MDELIHEIMEGYADGACGAMYSMCGNNGQLSYVPNYFEAVFEYADWTASLPVGAEPNPLFLFEMCSLEAPDQDAFNGSDLIIEAAAAIIGQGNQSVQGLKAVRDVTE